MSSLVSERLASQNFSHLAVGPIGPIVIDRPFFCDVNNNCFFSPITDLELYDVSYKFCHDRKKERKKEIVIV